MILKIHLGVNFSAFISNRVAPPPWWPTTGRESGWSCPKHKIKIKIAQEIQMMMILKIEMMSHAAFDLPHFSFGRVGPPGPSDH